MDNLRNFRSCLRSTTVATLIAAGALTVGCGRSESTEGPSLVMDSAPSGIHKTDIDFDGKVQLLGYKISRRPMKPGVPVTMTMYLKVLAKVEPGYKLSTKLLDDAGERLLDLDHAGALREEKDGKPTAAPETWQVGKIYADELKFAVPRNVKTARVQIVSGFVKGDQKLKVTNGSAVEGLALVATSSTDVKVPKKPRAPELPSVRVDQLDAKTKIKIDGKLDEEAWKNAPVASLGDIHTGRTPKKSPINGSVRVLWSKDGFYFAAEALDKDVIGGFEKGAKDPHLWTKDAIELMIDPDGDNKDYYEIQVNPQNLVFDSQFDEQNKPMGGPEGPYGHQEWSANLKSAVSIQGTLDKSDDEDQGYTVEAFVPWKSLDKVKPPAVGDNWRLNFYLMSDKKAVSWGRVPKGNFHDTSSFGKVLWATKDWTDPSAAPAPSAATAPGEVAKAPAAPAGAEAPQGAAKKALPSGIAERVQAAKPAPAAPAAPAAAPPAPAPAAPAAPAPGK